MTFLRRLLGLVEPDSVIDAADRRTLAGDYRPESVKEADVTILLAAGQPLVTVKVIRRKTDLSTVMYVTVNKSSTVIGKLLIETINNPQVAIYEISRPNHN